MTSHEHIDVSDTGFITCVILDIVQPKEIPQDNFWQEILVIILNLNAVKVSVNESVYASQDGQTHMYCWPCTCTSTV